MTHYTEAMSRLCQFIEYTRITFSNDYFYVMTYLIESSLISFATSSSNYVWQTQRYVYDFRIVSSIIKQTWKIICETRFFLCSLSIYNANVKILEWLCSVFSDNVSSNCLENLAPSSCLLFSKQKWEISDIIQYNREYKDLRTKFGISLGPNNHLNCILLTRSGQFSLRE